MSDRESLLAAIRANPDEDTPRLVYADWLEEHGDAKRAAYIRAQVEHARAARADTGANAVSKFVALSYRPGRDRINWAAVDAELGAACKSPRRAKLSAKGEGLPRVGGVTFFAGRGFFEEVMVDDTEAFLKHANDIFRAAPITRVAFDDLTAEQAAEFVRSGHLARVRELVFNDTPAAGALRALGTARDAAGVRKLELDTDSPAYVLEELAAGVHWTGLRELYAADFETDEEDEPAGEQFVAVATRPQFRGLRALTAWSNDVDDDGVKRLVKHLPELRYLDLALNPITASGAAALKSLRHLRALDLGTCDMEDGATVAADLVNGPWLPNLSVLKLSGNYFAGLDPKRLKRPGRGPGLRALDLGGAHLAPADLEALVRCPAAHGLWLLDLVNTRLDNEHVERFVAHAAFTRLAVLGLHSNNFGPRGAKALAAWPGAANLQWLDLGSNPVGASGATALAASPYLRGLRHIGFSGRGTATLKARFKKAFA